MEDFNVALSKLIYKLFAMNHKSKTWNKERTRFKSYMSQSCIYLHLTNCSKSFGSTLTIETGISDFHKLVGTLLKVKHGNVPPKIM